MEAVVCRCHFAGSDDLVAVGFHLTHQFNAGPDGLFCLDAGHGRTVHHVPGAGSNAAVNRSRHSADHAYVYREHIRVGCTGHQVDIGRALRNGLCHQRSHLAARLGNALRHHAVIGTENQRAPPVNADVRRFMNASDFDDHILQ